MQTLQVTATQTATDTKISRHFTLHQEFLVEYIFLRQISENITVKDAHQTVYEDRISEHK